MEVQQASPLRTSLLQKTEEQSQQNLLKVLLMELVPDLMISFDLVSLKYLHWIQYALFLFKLTSYLCSFFCSKPFINLRLIIKTKFYLRLHSSNLKIYLRSTTQAHILTENCRTKGLPKTGCIATLHSKKLHLQLSLHRAGKKECHPAQCFRPLDETQLIKLSIQ